MVAAWNKLAEDDVERKKEGKFECPYRDMDDPWSDVECDICNDEEEESEFDEDGSYDSELYDREVMP